MAIIYYSRATTVQLYPGRDTFEFDQMHMTKNQSDLRHVIAFMTVILGIRIT